MALMIADDQKTALFRSMLFPGDLSSKQHIGKNQAGVPQGSANPKLEKAGFFIGQLERSRHEPSPLIDSMVSMIRSKT